jgi:serine/threonine protein kinase/Flp pilus assembly protein TadD
MSAALHTPSWEDIDPFIAAFEKSQARAGRADIADFLPGPEHPHFLSILRELVRADLEYSWRRGQSKLVEDYLAAFPQLRQDRAGLLAIAFEEYRLRQQAGEHPTPAEYRRRFCVDTREWPIDLSDHDATGTPALEEPSAEWPAAGDEFLGFRLVKELGQGAFGRVYLARQQGLADRLVALKVGRDLVAETQSLAQLQHSNIVPVYSVHRTGPLQALCMPYFGSTTLADLFAGRAASAPSHLPTSPPGSIASVLALVARLADGLAYAHGHGILHLDLKPANVLLADDGTPMLLDFSLAWDTKPHRLTSAAYVGGTLPYMAPEQLEAFRDGRTRADPRSDVYALGLILWQWLTGRAPYSVPTGSLEEQLAHLLAERRRSAPDVRQGNREISPAVASIVGHCLQSDPARRYQSAGELRDDIERHLADLPLRHAPEPSWLERLGKWARRHPQLTSAYTAGAVVVLVVLALGSLSVARGRQVARLEAVAARQQTAADLQVCRFLLGSPVPSPDELREGMEAAQRALDRHHVLDNAAWQTAPAVRELPAPERDRLRGEVGELLLLLSRGERLQGLRESGPVREERLQSALRLTEQAEACGLGDEGLRPLRLQRVRLLETLGRPAEARDLAAQAETLPLTTARDHYLAAVEAMSKGDYRRARGFLLQARRLGPPDAFVLFGLGICHAQLRDHGKAAAALESSMALYPNFHGSHYYRGGVHHQQKEYAEAVAEFTEAIRLRPDYLPAYIDRALAKLDQKEYKGAEADLTHALDAGAPATRLLFLRARIRQLAGDVKGANADRAEALRHRPDDELGWIARGVARLAQQPAGALADFEEALMINPASRDALQDKAHVLSERLGRLDEAVKTLDRALELYPEDVDARAGRGVLLARLGRRDAALRDAEEVLRLDDRPFTLYQVAGIYAQTSRRQVGDRREALSLLAKALRGGTGLDLLDGDPDLDPVRRTPEFDRVVKAAKALCDVEGRPK